MTARENKINLARRKQELLDELNELREGGQPDADINSGLVVRDAAGNSLMQNSLRNAKAGKT